MKTRRTLHHVLTSVTLLALLLPAASSSAGGAVQPVASQSPSSATSGPANSPWPMYQHDAQRTSRSPYFGPTQPYLKWHYPISPSSTSSPSIAPDGTIYVGGSDKQVHAIRPDGTQKWVYGVASAISGSAAIAQDGTVYIGHVDYSTGTLVALNPTGGLRWSHPARGVRSSPAIAPDGTIYVGASNARLYAINPDGSLKWKYLAGFKESYSSPAIGADGTIYIAGCKERNIHAVNPDGTTKWTYPIGSRGDTISSPTIDASGTIYIGGSDNKFYALNPNGTLKWSYSTGDLHNMEQSAAIGPSGTVYVITTDGRLYAFTPAGQVKWTYYIGAGTISTTPAVDSDEVVYFGARNGKVYAINSDGSEKWVFQTPAARLLSSISIGSDGTLYVSGDGGVYAIGEGGAPDREPPAAIDDLAATPGSFPGDIVLSWTAPGDDGDSGTASLYDVRQESVLPIRTESDWSIAAVMEGAPTPLAAGTVQTMTVSLIPGGTSYFAMKARDDAENWSGLSNSPSAKAPGRLASNINAELQYAPSAILNEEVTVLVIPVRTDDWTLGIGDHYEVANMLHHIVWAVEVLSSGGGAAAYKALVGGVLEGNILDNWMQMRAQLVWGLHANEDGDPTLLVWDEAAPFLPLMQHGVPYVVTGTLRQKTFYDLLGREDSFYYLDVESSSNQVVQRPSAAHPHFTIPEGYAYHPWEDIHSDGVTGYGDEMCTIGMVTERYPLDDYHYVRIRLMERLSGALVVRVADNEAAPDMNALALFCGTKRAAGGDDLHPGWLPIAKYLDTTTGQGEIQLLQGGSSPIVRHERQPTTLFGIEIGSPVDVHIYDPEGNHVGAVYDGSGDVIGMETEIPGTEYFYGAGDAPEVVSISNPTAGAYTVTVRGTDTGTYTQTLRFYDSSGEQTYASTVTSQPTSADQEDTLVVDEIPAAPAGLQVTVHNGAATLDWDDNEESDLAGYNVYRSPRANGVYQRVNGSLLTASSFVDASNSTTAAYYYYVTAEDTDHNESGHLAPVLSRHLVYLPLGLLNY